MSVPTTAPHLPTAAAESLSAGFDDAALRTQIYDLADRLTEATSGLRALVADKARLNRFLDEVLESIDAGVVLQRADGSVMAANHAARSLGAVSGGDGALALSPALRDAAQLDGPVRPQGDDGPAWLARRKKIALPDAADGHLLVVHDVTRLVQLEQRAGRKSRLELLGRMAAELAHEVRNPLGSLELFASLLVDELEHDAERQELASQIQLGVRQLSATVNRLLASARGSRTRRATHDAVELIETACEFVRPVAISRGIDIRFTAEPASIDALLDREAVHQALLNLLGNALEVSSEGNAIHVDLSVCDDSLVLRVDDEGPGIDEPLRAQVFEPFFTTFDQGTGLGLALVDRVAEGHGGSVHVDESPQGGARFVMRLPLAGEPAGAEQHA